MRRREFIALGGAAMAWPLGASAQQRAKVPLIGYLTIDPSNYQSSRVFVQGLRDLGYVEGHNVLIEYRDAEGKFERLPALAAELVALNVDVIVAPGAKSTGTIPIVFAGVARTDHFRESPFEIRRTSRFDELKPDPQRRCRRGCGGNSAKVISGELRLVD